MMDEREDLLERVLRGLKEQQLPDSMEQRLLAALHARRDAAASHGGVAAQPRWVWMAACAVAILAASMLLVPHDRRAPARTVVAARSQVVAPRTAERAPLPRVSPVAGMRRHLQHRVVIRHEMARLVSYPAPPEPLTMQEKLLLQMAEHPTPEELALLDPVAQAKQEAAEAAQFAKYVAQADAPDQR